MIHSHNQKASTHSGSVAATSDSEPWATPHLLASGAPHGSTLNTATRAKNLVRESTREAGTLVNEGAQRFSASARELASEALAKISHQARSTQSQLNGYAHGTTRYMAAHPLRSAALSVVVGLLIAQVARGFRASRGR